MKIAICDDEKVFRDALKEYCLQFTKEKQIECQIVEYASGEELLCDFSPDILLLEIEMDGKFMDFCANRYSMRSFAVKCSFC